jgi:hypothetical protein
MSWHPYNKEKRTWTIYWEQRPAASSSGDDMLEFELTDPGSLDRDDWRDLQIWLLQQLTPPDYTLNISHLWGRNWPTDSPFRFNRIKDVHKIPVILSGNGERKTQPGKRQDYYWVLVQTPPDREALKDVVFFHSIDLEDITWITEKPLAPFPDQMFLHNDAVLAWNGKQLTTPELDEIVRRETWALTLTRFGHMSILVPNSRVSSEALWNLLRKGAADYNLEIESTTFDKRPPKPPFLTGLAKMPFGLVGVYWERLKAKEKARGR